MNSNVVLFSLMLIGLTVSLAAEETAGSLTIERIASIKYPSNPTWSPTGQQIAFLWDEAGNQNLFSVQPGKQPVALTSFSARSHDLAGDISDFRWISSNSILFLKAGKLWTVSSTGELDELEGIMGIQDFAISPNKQRLAIIKEGQLWTIVLDGVASKQITTFTENFRAARPVFSSNGSHLAFTALRTERVLDILPYNGNKLGLYRNKRSDSQVGVVPVNGGTPIWFQVNGRVRNVQWIDTESVLFQNISADMKTREIIIGHLDGHTRTLRSDHDERWWSPIRRDARTVVSPNGRLVAFFSDAEGWSHLYVIPTDAKERSPARQLTSGAFETGFGNWSQDSKHIAFYDNKQSPMERFIRVVNVETGHIQDIVTKSGVNYWPKFSPNGRKIVFERTDTENSVDLYVAEVPSAPLTRLTHSMPEEIQKSDLTPPIAVEFPSRADHKLVPGTLFVPKDLDRSQQHPAIIWIHGSGSDQNFLGWHPFSYRMYYSAHQYLLQQGYVVLTVDYRGSSGYGRDWGTGHHLDLGGVDALDVASGADYLKTLSYVNGDQIGVWGLSYGGFLTLQVMTMTPNLFRCGIDVAGVTDWTTWGLESNGGWITGRMSTPEKNPEGYHRSAPRKHLETLQRPLLILHGTRL